MSYTMKQYGSVFFISNENVSPAFQALKLACKERNLFDGLKKAHHLDRAFEIFGWELEFDDDENVTKIRLLKSYYGEEEILFSTIAPYVKANSFIEMVGEDHETWRWIFDGTTCQRKLPTITW